MQVGSSVEFISRYAAQARYCACVILPSRVLEGPLDELADGPTR